MSKIITVRSKNNNIFHYDIFLNDKNIVIAIDNQWDVNNIPVWLGMVFDIKWLIHYIKNERPDFYIE